MMTASSLDQNQNFLCVLFDEATPVHQKIMGAIAELHRTSIIKNKAFLSISRIAIAKKARCSLSSVRDFIRKYEGLVFNHRTIRRPDCYKHDVSEYFINPHFFEFIVHLQLNSYFHRWKSKRLGVLKNLLNDDLFLIKKTAHFYKFSTINLPTVLYENLPTLKSYLNSTYKKVLERKCKQKPAPKILDEIPLTFDQKVKLSLTCAPIDIRESVLQYKKYTYTWGNRVKSPFGFIKSQAEKNCRRRINL